MLAIFLGGLSLHDSQALLAHMFEVDMIRGATSKAAEFSSFFIEVPKGLKSVSDPVIPRNYSRGYADSDGTMVQMVHSLQYHVHCRNGYYGR